MRALAAALCVALATPALAEMRDEEHLVGDRMVKIRVVDTFEIMTAGPSDSEQMQVLSGADVELVALAGDLASVAQLGQPVLVAEVAGTFSCDDGDAREYWVVTLGVVPTPEGPVTSCQALTASVTSGAVVLEADPAGEASEAWAWMPGKGWGSRAE